MHEVQDHLSWPAWVALVALVGVLVASCGILGPDSDRVVGFIETNAEMSLVVDVPDSAAISVPFAISVNTYGGGCDSMDDTEVVLEGNVARITPYDRETTGGGGCTTPLRTFVHQATVRFDAAGEAIVVVIGRKFFTDELVRHEFAVTVF